MYDENAVGVFIGRFQPFHLGHLEVLIDAYKKGIKKFILVIGSADAMRSPRNPWTVDQVAKFARLTIASYADTWSIDADDDVIFLSADDNFASDAEWAASLAASVEAAAGPDAVLYLLGTAKDSETQSYLLAFPQWVSAVCLPKDFDNGLELCATKVRELLFEGGSEAPALRLLSSWVAAPVVKALSNFTRTPEFVRIRSEYQHWKKEKAKWAGSPYPPVFVTVDAVVVQSAHVLLVERLREPGKGMVALPGGFINQSEYLVDAMLRELKEETKINESLEYLRTRVRVSQVFDYPNRSQRGRTITHAFLIDLGLGRLPAVQGGDDAKSAFWVPLAALDKYRGRFFEDHKHIITAMTARLKNPKSY